MLSWDGVAFLQAALERWRLLLITGLLLEGVREAIRGVNSDGVISLLREKKTLREVGKEADRDKPFSMRHNSPFLRALWPQVFASCRHWKILP